MLDKATLFLFLHLVASSISSPLYPALRYSPGPATGKAVNFQLLDHSLLQSHSPSAEEQDEEGLLTDPTENRFVPHPAALLQGALSFNKLWKPTAWPLEPLLSTPARRQEMVGCLKSSGFILVALKTMHMVYASLTRGFSVACVQAQAGELPKAHPVSGIGVSQKMTVLLQSTGTSHSQLSPLPVWFFPFPLFLDAIFVLLALLSCFSTNIDQKIYFALLDATLSGPSSPTSFYPPTLTQFNIHYVHLSLISAVSTSGVLRHMKHPLPSRRLAMGSLSTPVPAFPPGCSAMLMPYSPTTTGNSWGRFLPANSYRPSLASDSGKARGSLGQGFADYI
uniref:Uncharacterized protein n=1 Tax=Pavo cristatus TaxID=9049 RepID=A0A8C9F655_PAVCR